MDSEPQVSQWLKAAKAGNGHAVEHLWKRYYPQMLRARQALERGRFPRFNDRNGLWRLLIEIMTRKAIDHCRRETWDSDHKPPDLTALIIEVLEERLKMLTPPLRQLALAKLEGYTNREAAEQLGTTEHAVEYGLKVIRKNWNALDLGENAS